MAYTEDMMFEPIEEQIEDPIALGMARDSWHAADVPMDWADANPYTGMDMGMPNDMGMDPADAGIVPGMGEPMGGADVGGMLSPLDSDFGMDTHLDLGPDLSMAGEMPQEAEPTAQEASTMRDAMVSRMGEDASRDAQYQEKMRSSAKQERKMSKL